MGRLDRSDGDIDTLMSRIAHIRTWTYIAHRPEWLADAPHWQERARAIEDRLSDALHDRITQRFVDRRSAFLVRQLGGARRAARLGEPRGEVKVEGHSVGRLDGFRFVPDARGGGEARTLLAAANRVLRGEIAARARAARRAPRRRVRARRPTARVLWRGGAVGRLLPGETRAGAARRGAARRFPRRRACARRVRQRLAAFVGEAMRRGLGALFRAREADARRAGARPRLPARRGARQPAGARRSRRCAPRSTAATGKALARLGVRLGTETVYFDRC